MFLSLLVDLCQSAGTMYKSIWTLSIQNTNIFVRGTKVVTKEQVKMARAGIGWGVRELAEKAGLTANTVSRFENGYDAMGNTIKAIQQALESAGIEFLPDNGVRLKG